MKILLTLLLLIPSLSWGENHELTRQEALEKLKSNKEILTFEEFTDADEKEIIDKDIRKRNVWTAKCYLDARKDADIVSDNDALLVKKYCETLSYEKFPKTKN